MQQEKILEIGTQLAEELIQRADRPPLAQGENLLAILA